MVKNKEVIEKKENKQLNQNIKNLFKKKYIYESIGSALLVFFGCGNIVFGSSKTGLESALTFGFVYIVCYYFFEKISGCHLNPAVSLACLIRKQITGKDFGIYCLYQVFGSIAGSALLCIIILCSFSSFNVDTTCLGANLFAEGSASGITLAGCMIVEFIITLIFVLVFLSIKSNKENLIVASIVVGITMVAIYLFALPLTGASANPARSFGPAIMMFLYGKATPLIQLPVFIFSTMAGGAFAGYLHKHIRNYKTRI